MSSALDLVDPELGRRDGLVLLVVEEVVLARERLVLDLLVRDLRAAEGLRDAREVVVGLGGRGRLAGDDQRRPRLVDQDRVDLVHDRVRMAALDEALERVRHVVAEVVEAELGVRAVGDVGLVGDLALVERHLRLDERDVQPEPLVDAAVPLGVTLGEVVVDRDEVHALADRAAVVRGHGRKRVEVEREAGDEGLALTGLHLGHVALVQHDAAHQLHVEHALVGLAEAGLAHGGVGLEEHVVQVLAVGEPLAELGRLRAQLIVGERLELAARAW